MTTKSLLIARIADDLARADLTSQIGNAIDDAITHYQPMRFFFNETRLATFVTVAAQSTYTASDDTDVPLFIELDAVMLSDGTNTRELEHISPTEIERLLDSSASSGRPTRYSYYEQSFRFYPVPDIAYTIRPIGLIEKAGPATDDELNNVWCVYAFELIRCRAKLLLTAHVIVDPELASIMSEAERQAYDKLRRETSKKQSGGVIEATCF
jgi:hypothetical protein